VISYANSGDVLIGDRSRVVGYGAVAFLNGDGKPDLAALRKSPELSRESALQPADKQVLLTLARDTIRRYLSTGTLPLVRGYDPSLARKRGAFVTLKKGGRLRGCIGRLSEDLPLAQTVAAMAAQAAFNDRRFSPLAMEEFTEIEIEISVLTTAKPVKGFEDIQTGRDGVILQKEGRSSVFLPQVAVEYRWGRPELLDNLCRKAGLSSGCWKQGATFRTFQAEVFGESGFE
jgi:AmmeMemoRadiSam system protein A